MVSTKEKIPIAEELDVSTARIEGGRLADEAGLGRTEKYCVMTSISELASNIFHHAGSGEIEIGIVTRADGIKGIEIVASDHGKGIEDIELAIQDGYSTSGGLGSGLAGVKRLMSEMELTSTWGKGTLVRAVKWQLKGE